jgi:hypothetical protein
MHIHGNQINLNAVNPYSAAAEKAAAAQRAADVRKKLMKSGASLEGIADPEEAFMVGHWMNSTQGPAQNDDEYHASPKGKKKNLG